MARDRERAGGIERERKRGIERGEREREGDGRREREREIVHRKENIRMTMHASKLQPKKRKNQEGGANRHKKNKSWSCGQRRVM